MNHMEVTLFFNELHLKAVQEELAADGMTLEDKLKEHFAFLYDQLVSPEKQLGIEAEIEQIEAQENAEREARRRFGVFHIHENASDRYFTSELFDSLLSTAYRYRLYDRGELSANPKAFAEAFGEVEHISAAQYEELCDRMPSDHRIRVAADYDLDAGTVTNGGHFQKVALALTKLFHNGANKFLRNVQKHTLERLVSFAVHFLEQYAGVGAASS